MNPGYQLQVAPFTPMVKKLVIINVAVWVGLVLIVQQFFMSHQYIFLWFGLQPLQIISHFSVWQLFTYMFLHSQDVFHVLFNMILLWWIGSELEQRWGFSPFSFLLHGLWSRGRPYLFLWGLFVLSFHS